MKYIPLVCFIISIAWLSCVKPERDNEYDPNNPCKAYMSGTIYGHDSSIRIPDANFALVQDSEIAYEVQSDINGKYSIEEIDPGIYGVEVKAMGYMLYTDSVDLWAGREVDSADVYLYEMFFDFEDVPINTQEPYRFRSIEGDWAVVDAPGQGHVYAGRKGVGVEVGFARLDIDFRDCYVDVLINLLSSSTGYPGASLIVKHRDPLNYYWVGIGHDYIKLYKVENGVDIELYANHAVMLPFDHWHELQVEITGDLFTVTIPGVTEFTVNDAGWSTGMIGFNVVNWDGAGFTTEALFDDLYIDAFME